MTDRDQLTEALLNAVIFDQRDNVSREPGRAAATSKTIRDGIRLLLDFPTDEMVEALAADGQDVEIARGDLEVVRRVMFGEDEAK